MNIYDGSEYYCRWRVVDECAFIQWFGPLFRYDLTLIQRNIFEYVGHGLFRKTQTVSLGGRLD